MSRPKVLILDIETSPIITYAWGLFDQNFGLNQIKDDWHLLAVACKWLGDPPSKVIYSDQRNKKDISDDKDLCKMVWKLLDEADVVIGQNSKCFDLKKLNARFVHHGMKPPSSYKQIDTLQIAKKHFGFTSNKLEYMTNSLCKKYKKLTHKKFPGFELWKECLKGNKAAWREMAIYNQHDILSTEELYTKLQAWDNTLDFNVYREGEEIICNCGSKKFTKNGIKRLAAGAYQRFTCEVCGKETRDKHNLIEITKRKNLRPGSR